MSELIDITIDADEQRIVVHGLSDLRNSLLREGKPTEDVDVAILKIANASPRRRRRADREAR